MGRGCFRKIRKTKIESPLSLSCRRAWTPRPPWTPSDRTAFTLWSAAAPRSPWATTRTPPLQLLREPPPRPPSTCWTGRLPSSSISFRYVEIFRYSSESRGVIILALDPDPESDCQVFADSGTGFRSSKKRNRNTYGSVMILALD